MYIILLLIIIILISIFQVIYKHCEKIKIYKNMHFPKNTNILLIGGTHGNEPAGSYVLEIFRKQIYNLRYFNLSIIPQANQCGLSLNTRYLPHRIYNRDLNRNYKESNYSIPSIESEIYNEVIKNDIIIDLHEGYDFHKLNKKSVGSTIFSNSNLLKKICMKSVTDINKHIKDEHRKFTYLSEIENKQNSMRMLCDKLNKNYILIETSGQNNIQPLKVRVNQQLFIINNILNQLNDEL